MRKLSVYALFCILVVNAAAEIYFSEEFDSDWEKRWVLSKSKGADAGKFATSAGKYYEDSGDKGLKTTEDYRFYQISAKLDKEFDNKGKDLFFQFTVKHEQNIDCGGGYFKLLPAPLDQTSFSGDSPYHVMFGPDFCGGTRKCHVIFTHNGKNFLIKKNINAPQDTFTHLYQLRLHPDQSFEVYIDGEEKLTGNLLDEDLFDFLPPKRIPDPNVHKPKDWVDEKEILDPEAKKPAGWDDIPEYITDSEAKQPEDWDSELDGDWEAPQIPNPDYKGPWVHPKIPNPAYKGPWEAPIIDNPEYKEDNSIYHFVSNYVGLEIWQVKSGSIFDAILVTDDSKVAQKWSDKVLKEIKEEKARFDKEEEERKAREEEERKQRDAELDEEEGEDDEEKDDDHHHDEL